MLKTICVFCSSSSKIDEVYFKATLELADLCIKQKIHVLYGGGAFGLMGALADRMIKKKGKISGIIPSFMLDLKWGHDDISEMIVVEDLRERKKRMIDNVDAVVALPGGVGTLEELLEVITLKQLGKFTKPIIIVNTHGFYDPLFRIFDQMIEKQFMRDVHRQLWITIDRPADLLYAIKNTPEMDTDFNKIL